jgi:hypothetical protein
MIKIIPSEMHLLVLICSNPKHPQIRALLGSLGNDAKAIAILILERLGVTELPQIPGEIAAENMTEIKAAADEFSKMIEGRQREHSRRSRAIAAGR